MNFKNFRINILLRVFLILLMAFGMAYCWLYTEWWFTPAVLFIILIIVVVNLVLYIEKTNIRLTHFLLSIKQGAFTSSFQGNKNGAVEAHLSAALNDIIKEFQKLNLEKESQFQYLKTLNENIGVGLISYSEDGNIEMLNPAAKNLIRKPFLRNIDELKSIDSHLFETIKKLKPEEKQVIKTYIGGEMQQLSVQLKEFVVQQKSFKLILIQNLLFELDQKEVEAWQKLIGVLTHEIMNSVTPIASLSAAINAQLKDQDINTLTAEDGDDIYTSLDTVEKRSKGLIKFINTYKEFSKTPDLTLRPFNLVEVVKRITQLLEPDMQQAEIKHTIHAESQDIKVNGDQNLIEQVIINLLKNAIEAIDDSERLIDIKIYHDLHRVRLSISNSGSGLSPTDIEKVFIPFYTTKKSGSGIGLSFARQIMKLHNGGISARSENGTTTFTLTL
ncbi:sensor histidine kinase [Fulvivirga ligni]|uniref:sensor histidine kinase n=1 Tax=Fulvivirga ligni TaxID=2904246 RepID=UPI001F2CEA91|nr:ATP-binding protein [Fulvivirga ligni]UII22482.1 ATP-binding protein [Fulvivirga ligni]